MPIEETIRRLARFGEFYWSDGGIRNRGAFTSLADAGWREAVAAFLRDFACERQGASRDFPVAAVQALEAQARQDPDRQLADRIWSDFLPRLGGGGRGANPKLQPIRPSEDATLSVFDLVSRLGDYDHNLMRWARECLYAGAAGRAFRELQRVRGIGPKIASFYLRDVVDGFVLDESTVEPAIAIQPIDVWTERGAKALAPLLDLDIPRTSAQAAAVIVEGARRAEVRATLVNTGLWIFPARFLGSNLTFGQALADERAFAVALDGAEARANEELRQARARLSQIETIRHADR